MRQLGKVTKAVVEEVEKLKKFLQESKVNLLKTRISKWDIPLQEFHKILEYLHRDFEELQQMDVYWNQCNEDEIKAIVQEVNENVNTHVQQKELHFDSPFEVRVYHQLGNLGYEVTTQVGMSGYRIDMAIVHPHDTSRYILGIECDGAMYHSSKNAKERDEMFIASGS